MAQSLTGSYSGDSLLHTVDSSSPSAHQGGDAAMPLSGPSAGDKRHHLRQTLRRNTDESLGEDRSARRRFSKRHSKAGLAAVF